MIKYLMKYDKRTRYISAMFIVIIAAILTYFFVSSGGSYFPAWLSILGGAVALLAMLSIPRYVILSTQSVEIHCIMELTQIKLNTIERVKILDQSDMKWCVPFLGVWGIFGYYGYYINLRKMRTFKMYARKWNNFILVEDKNDNKFIFSVENREEFIEELEKRL